MEAANWTLEQYLRIYADYQQDNWVGLLPMAEFAYNNAHNESTGTTPFYANYGFHPRISPSSPPSLDPVNPNAEERARLLQEVRDRLTETLTEMRRRSKEATDRKRRPAPEYRPGDRVWLDRRYIRTARPSEKLDDRRLGPFEIVEVINPVAVRLRLPASMKIHNVFHVSLVEPAREAGEDEFPGRKQPQPLPVIVDNREEWEVKKILDSKIMRGRLFYLVDWKGYGPEERSWEPVGNVENAADAVAKFHRRYPEKPK